MLRQWLYSLQGTGKWYELQDLQVTDILPQMITLSEAYIQVGWPQTPTSIEEMERGSSESSDVGEGMEWD